jgi:hypothetical protein|tara:strand:- start:166 stop:495 length:330 start_codon:yes stop_codon:yes gene_type:complete
MGVHLKKYTLTNGQVVTAVDVMKKTKVGKSAARHRLAVSDDPKVVFAPIHTKGIGGYKKNKHVANEAAKEAAELSKKAKLIEKTHAHYDKGEKGKLHRLLWGKWFGSST